MGLSWRSYAEVISFEPQTVKELIEDIVSNYDTTGVYDLKIEDNSVFFNSDGYGGYGMKTGNRESLFELLTEKYEGAIACFEYAESCQAEFYCFACGVVSTQGEQDWNTYILITDEDICLKLAGKESLRKYLCREELHWDYMDPEYKESSLDWWKDEQFCWDSRDESVYIWSISIDSLAKKKNQMPSLYSSYQKCGNNEKKITISLIDDWLGDDKISEDEYASIGEEVDWDCLDSLKDFAQYIVIDFPTSGYLEQEGIKLPENFPNFKAQPQEASEEYSFIMGHVCKNQKNT